MHVFPLEKYEAHVVQELQDRTKQEGTSAVAVVGLIANPMASGDIRRLVAHGRGVPAGEKVNIIRRVLLGLESLGVRRVVAMPDPAHLCRRARDDARLSLDLELLNMPVQSTAADSIQAATLMDQMGVGCLVTLGGDGTNRVVAKSCGQVPLVPISTGTNNVFPRHGRRNSGRLSRRRGGAGLGGTAGGLLHEQENRGCIWTGCCRTLRSSTSPFPRERFVASRAVWDMTSLHEVFLTRAEPFSLGLSSIGARLQPVTMSDTVGLYLRLGSGGTTVVAPVAPGLVSPVRDCRMAAFAVGPAGSGRAASLYDCSRWRDGSSVCCPASGWKSRCVTMALKW